MPAAPPPAVFLASALTDTAFPKATLPEVAFVGRSNVGKSTLLNELAGGGDLARVSRTPGRTRAVNFFRIGEAYVFVDLPGYGYARVPERVRSGWERLVVSYLAGRETLALNLLLVDIRRDPMESDREALGYLRAGGRRVAVVATKADKLRRSEAAAQARRIGEAFGEGEPLRVVPFSARPPKRGRSRAEGAGAPAIRRLIAEEVAEWRTGRTRHGDDDGTPTTGGR